MKTLSWPAKKAGLRDDNSPRLLRRRHRVVVADDDTPFARRLADYLFDHGFETRVVASVAEAKELIEYWHPDSIFLDMLLPATNALSIFKFINTHDLKKIPKVIVMSKQSLAPGVEQMRRAGAAHYLVKPFSLEEAFRAIDVEEVETDALPKLGLGPGTIKELHLLNLFLKQATMDEHNGLYNLMRMINLKVKAMRCSVVQIVSDKKGRVLASNDNEAMEGLEIDLTKYPEILEMRRTLEHVVVPNIRQSPMMAKVQKLIGKTPYETILLFPVFRAGTLYGALSIRMQQRDPLEVFYVEKFGQLCSQIIGLVIGTPGQRLINE